MKLSLLMGALLISSCQAAFAVDTTTTCIKQAEADYNVPRGLLAVMQTKELQPDDPKRLSAPYRDQYGPMGLHASVISFAAHGMQLPESAIKNDRCQNIRAAAWLLMNRYRGNKESDIFKAVNYYYYGLNAKHTGRMTQLIKKRYLREKESR